MVTVCRLCGDFIFSFFHSEQFRQRPGVIRNSCRILQRLLSAALFGNFEFVGRAGDYP
jgi:hypothetical protein